MTVVRLRVGHTVQHTVLHMTRGTRARAAIKALGGVPTPGPYTKSGPLPTAATPVRTWAGLGYPAGMTLRPRGPARGLGAHRLLDEPGLVGAVWWGCFDVSDTAGVTLASVMGATRCKEAGLGVG